MTAPIPVDVKMAIQSAREDGGPVQIDLIAGRLAVAFQDEAVLIKLMLTHAVMRECIRLQLPMALPPRCSGADKTGVPAVADTELAGR
jgi:hypothetical protein